jgi:hypothetical protein
MMYKYIYIIYKISDLSKFILRTEETNLLETMKQETLLAGPFLFLYYLNNIF